MSTELTSVLGPVLVIGVRIRCRVEAGSIDIEVFDVDVLRAPDQRSPELRLNDAEVLDDDVLGLRDGKGHWSTKLVSKALGIVVPDLTITVDPSFVVTFENIVMSANDKRERLVLESERNTVLDPILDVGGE